MFAFRLIENGILSMQRALLVVLLMFGITSCSAPPGNSTAGNRVADRMHAYIIGNARDYALTSGTKALAACIRWPAADGDPVYIDTLGGSYVADQSDGQLSTNLIINSAMRNCQGNQSSGGHDCDCELLDVGGSNRLVVPANVADGDIPIRTRRSKRKRSAPRRRAPERPEADYGGITSSTISPDHEQ